VVTHSLAQLKGLFIPSPSSCRLVGLRGRKIIIRMTSDTELILPDKQTIFNMWHSSIKALQIPLPETTTFSQLDFQKLKSRLSQP
jgi:hypothetical protein